MTGTAREIRARHCMKTRELQAQKYENPPIRAGFISGETP